MSRGPRWNRLANRVEHGFGQLVWLDGAAQAQPPQLAGWRRIEPAPEAPEWPALVRLVAATLASADDAELEQLALPLNGLLAASRGAVARLDPRLAEIPWAASRGAARERLARFAAACVELLVQLGQLRPTLLLLGELARYGRSFSTLLGHLFGRSPASRLLVVFAGSRPGCSAWASLLEDQTRNDLLRLADPAQPASAARPQSPGEVREDPEAAAWLLELFCYEAALTLCGSDPGANPGLRGIALAGLGRHADAESCFLAATAALSEDSAAELVELVLLRAANQQQADPTDPGAVALLFDAIGQLTTGLLDEDDFGLYERLASGTLAAEEATEPVRAVHPQAALARLFSALLAALPGDDPEQAGKVGLHGLVLAAKLGNREVLAELAAARAAQLLDLGQRDAAERLLGWARARVEGRVHPACWRVLQLQAARVALVGAELERADALVAQAGQADGLPELAVACEAALLAGQLALLRGQLRNALERSLAAHLLLRGHDDPEQQGRSLLLLGRSYLLLGNPALAADCARRCASLAPSAADIRLDVARLQAELAMAGGRLPEALPLLGPVLSAHDGPGLAQGLAWACLGTVLVGLSGGDPAALQQFAPLLEQALQRCQSLAEALPVFEARSLRFQGLFLAVSGAQERALATLAAAQQAGARSGVPLEQARAALERARLCHIWGVGGALPLLEQAEQLLNACGSQHDLRFLQQVRAQVFGAG